MHGDVLVVGSTGTLGSQVVRGLTAAGIAVRAATRDPATAVRRSGLDAHWVLLDLEQPSTFGSALNGVDQAFLMARPGDEEADRFARPLIDEMRRQGVRHVVNLTAMGAERRDDFALRRVELVLEASGMAWTHLRPNFFMQVFSGGTLLAQIRARGAFSVPAADARLSFVDVRDVAAVAVAALTEPGHKGRAWTLTGPDAVDHAAVAELLSRAVGRPIAYLPISEDAARAALAVEGLSATRIERLVGFYRMVRQGMCAPVSPDVANVLCRPAIPFAQFAADHATIWR